MVRRGPTAAAAMFAPVCRQGTPGRRATGLPTPAGQAARRRGEDNKAPAPGALQQMPVERCPCPPVGGAAQGAEQLQGAEGAVIRPLCRRLQVQRHLLCDGRQELLLR